MNIRFKHVILTAFIAAAIATTSASFAMGSGGQRDGYHQSGGYGGFSSQRSSEQRVGSAQGSRRGGLNGYGKRQGSGGFGKGAGVQNFGQSNDERTHGDTMKNRYTYQKQYRYE